MRKFIALIGVFAVVLLAGCITVQGLGKDLGKGGEAIQKVAK